MGGKPVATIINGQADSELADKIEAALNDQGITVERQRQKSATYVPRPSGVIKDAIEQRDPFREGYTYEPPTPKIGIFTPKPNFKCCITTITELPRFKEIFPIDPLARVRRVASSIWPF